MRDVIVQEIDNKGEVLEWSGDLLSIAQELLTEFDEPQLIHQLKLHVATYHRVGITASLGLFIAKMNSLKNGYKYTGSVQKASAIVNNAPNTTFNKEVVLGLNTPKGDETQ